MDRRQFLTWVGVGVLASNLPVLIAACSGSSNSESNQSNAEVEKTPRADGFLEVGTLEEVTQKGQIIVNKNPKVVVLRNPQDNKLLAVDPTCKHQGCTVKWKEEINNFVCPCHGSKFTPDGKVLNGPAKDPLSNYEVKEEKGLVLVKVVT